MVNFTFITLPKVQAMESKAVSLRCFVEEFQGENIDFKSSVDGYVITFLLDGHNDQ